MRQCLVAEGPSKKDWQMPLAPCKSDPDGAYAASTLEEGACSIANCDWTKARFSLPDKGAPACKDHCNRRFVTIARAASLRLYRKADSVHVWTSAVAPAALVPIPAAAGSAAYLIVRNLASQLLCSLCGDDVACVVVTGLLLAPSSRNFW